jgi:Tol biopolymer transport system component
MGDLYVAFRANDGTWSSSKKLNNEINTSAFEFAPNVSPDGKYLFFTRDDTIYWVGIGVLHL